MDGNSQAQRGRVTCLQLRDARETHPQSFKGFRVLYFCLIYASVCLSCACLQHTCRLSARCPWRSEESSTPPRTGLTDGWGLPCGYQERHRGSLQEQVLLTTEPSFQPLPCDLNTSCQPLSGKGGSWELEAACTIGPALCSFSLRSSPTQWM